MATYYLLIPILFAGWFGDFYNHDAFVLSDLGSIGVRDIWYLCVVCSRV